MKKRSMISLLLAVLLVFGLAGGAFAADYPQNTFDDVKPGDWFNDAVNFAQATELMKGVGNNRFDPYGAVTRAMVVTVLYRMADEPDVADKANPFTDVSNDSGNWYLNPVKWAVANGITQGTGGTTFSPMTPITREQMAAMITRFLVSSSGEDFSALEQIQKLDPTGLIVLEFLSNGFDYEGRHYNGFGDAASISSYARMNVLLCLAAGIMKGDTNGNFRPKATLTRAECAQTFLNLYSIGQ